ncbi:MAG: VWA domain-containing protein [Myxococcales bacterium]|nr:VWA domain-containing protein [Myxococcales bacterium]
MSDRRHPMLVPGLLLALGLLAALALERLAPGGEPWTIELPAQLAAYLSSSGDRTLVLSRPRTLWLTPLALLPFLIATAWRSLVDLPWWQVLAQLLIRLLLLMALALALAFPSLESPIRGKTVVLAVDLSESIDEGQRARAEELVRQAAEAVAAEDAALAREDRTRLRLVTYAERAQAVDLEAQREQDAGAGASSLLTRDPDHALASDHAAGLRLAEALLDPETEGRILLVTDGGGTPDERGGLSTAVQGLERRGVTVHTRSFPASVRGDVMVAGVHLPEELRVGQTFDVAVDLVASEPGTLTLRLDKDGAPNELAPSLEVQLRGGRQQVKLPARVTAPGAVVFTASLDTRGLAPERNRSALNDHAAVVGDVRGRPRVLLATSEGDGAALARALRADHLHVETTAASALPDSVDGLRPHDLVIYSDVPAGAVGNAQRQALTRYVKDFGGGFIMVGGERSFGVGGWGGTIVEDLLPVRFEGERQKEQPTLALLLVIDKSGSMSSEDRIDLVKEAARLTAATLDPTDELGVIAFDSRAYVLVRLQPAANRIRIANKIRSLRPGGGTNALPALREAYLQLSGSRALVKHVILLSDGQSPEAGIGSLLADMRDADVTVSTVGVGAGAGKDFLARVARRGRGRYYFSHDGTDVPRIFSRETREVTRNAIVERRLYPRVAKPVQALRGIDFSAAPGLLGIVPVKPKKLAEVLLRTQLGDALLVRGRRGLGRTVAFASDAKPRWAAHWVTWSGFAKLWSQLARDTMRQGAGLVGGATIAVTPAGERDAWKVSVDIDATSGFANDLRGVLRVVDPAQLPAGAPDDRAAAPDDRAADDNALELPLELTAPGRYEATVHGVESGQRLLKAQLHDEDDPSPTPRLVAEAVAQVSVPYPPELSPEQLAPDPTWLSALGGARATHDGPIGDLLTTPGESGGRTHAKPLWPLVLWGLALPLLLLDLLLRRVAFGTRRLARA